MASPGSGAGCPLSPGSSLLLRFFILVCGGFCRTSLLVCLLEIIFKVLIESLLNYLGEATLQPVGLHLLVEEFLPLDRISRHLAAFFAGLLSFAEALEWLTALFILVIAISLVFLLFAQLGYRDLLLCLHAFLLAFRFLATCFAVSLFSRCISVAFETSSSPIKEVYIIDSYTYRFAGLSPAGPFF